MMTGSDQDRKARGDFLRSNKGRIFVFGCFMLIIWVESIAVLWHAGYQRWFDVLTMGLTHSLAGRAASIAHGTQAGMPAPLIAFLAAYFDIMSMLIIFPIFVFSYQNLFERRFFQKHMKPMFETAQRELTRFRRFKIVGLFFFVWFPFWMTGIIVGSIIGFLLGLRTWVTILTVSLGSISAVISWVFFYDKLFGGLGEIHQGIPIAISSLIILTLIALRVISRRKRTRGNGT